MTHMQSNAANRGREMTRTINDNDRRTLQRIRNGEVLPVETTRNLVRRGIVRKVTIFPAQERREWGRVVCRNWTWEIVPGTITEDGA